MGGCVLVVSVNPDLVSAEEFEVLRREITVLVWHILCNMFHPADQ
jgi:hypothetical protein